MCLVAKATLVTAVCQRSQAWHLRGCAGSRAEYHEHLWRYFRDPDGNKLCVACHVPMA